MRDGGPDASIYSLSERKIRRAAAVLQLAQPTEMRSGRGWYVQFVYSDKPPLQLGGFKTEEEAKEWVSDKSAAWLKERAEDRYGYPTQ